MLKFFTGSIARRVFSLLILFVVGLVGLVAYQLSDSRSTLVELKKTEIKSVIEAAVGVLGYYVAKV